MYESVMERTFAGLLATLHLKRRLVVFLCGKKALLHRMALPVHACLLKEVPLEKINGHAHLLLAARHFAVLNALAPSWWERKSRAAVSRAV
jgi:hypothetical protein